MVLITSPLLIIPIIVFTPTLKLGNTVTIPLLVIPITTFAPIIDIGQKVTSPLLVIPVTTFAPSLKIGITPITFNQGLYILIKRNFPEVHGLDSQGNIIYKVFNIQTFNTIQPPYVTFCRHSRIHEKDLENNDVVWVDKMSVKIYHDDSLLLESMQLKMRNFLEGLYHTTVGGKYLQKICAEDDYQQPFIDSDKGLLLFEGVIEIEVIYHP